MTTIPEGWQLVPKEPIEEMCVAAHHALYHWREKQGDPQQDPTNMVKHAIRYRAMLAAAPAPLGDAREIIDDLKWLQNATWNELSNAGNPRVERVATYVNTLRATNARMREAISRASAMLQVPAAEYVPAMSDAWVVLDEAVHTTLAQEQP